AGLASARRLDRGVERQQVGLAGDVADQLDHVADLLRRLRECRDLVVGGLRLADRGRHYVGRLRQLAADLGDRARQLVGRRGGGLNVGGGLIGGLRGAFGALRGLARGRGQRRGRRAHLGRTVGDGLEQGFNAVAEAGDGAVGRDATILLRGG